MNLKEKIYNFCKTNGNDTTFAMLNNYFESENVDYIGEYWLYLPNHEHVVLWGDIQRQ